MLLPVPVPKCRFFSWGFVCTDSSSRNINSGRNRADQILAHGEKQSGSTWKGGLNYIRTARPDSGIAENVKQVASNPDVSSSDCKDGHDLQSSLAIAQADLASIGYSSIAILASPHEMVLPQSRWRALIPFSKTLGLQELHAVAAEFDELRQILVPFTLEQCMLSPDDPLLDAELHRQLAMKGDTLNKNLSNASQEKWRKRDRRAASKCAVSKYADEKLSMTLPWLDALAVREHAALLAAGDNARIINVAQHGDQCCLKTDAPISPCLTKKVELWDYVFWQEREQ